MGATAPLDTPPNGTTKTSVTHFVRATLFQKEGLGAVVFRKTGVL